MNRLKINQESIDKDIVLENDQEYKQECKDVQQENSH